MSLEDIPVEQYEKLAKTFKPKPNIARDWARLAKQAGMKYMVLTTKHHEGFCNFDSKLTDYCATKQGPGRDLVDGIPLFAVQFIPSVLYKIVFVVNPATK